MSGYLEKGIQTPMAQGRSTKIILRIEWVRNSWLSIKNSLAGPRGRRDPGAMRGLQPPALALLSGSGLGFWAFRVWVFGFGFSCLGFGVWGLGSRIWGLGFGVCGLGFGI